MFQQHDLIEIKFLFGYSWVCPQCKKPNYYIKHDAETDTNECLHCHEKFFANMFIKHKLGRAQTVLRHQGKKAQREHELQLKNRKN